MRNYVRVHCSIVQLFQQGKMPTISTLVIKAGQSCYEESEIYTNLLSVHCISPLLMELLMELQSHQHGTFDFLQSDV